MIIELLPHLNYSLVSFTMQFSKSTYVGVNIILIIFTFTGKDGRDGVNGDFVNFFQVLLINIMRCPRKFLF